MLFVFLALVWNLAYPAAALTALLVVANVLFLLNMVVRKLWRHPQTNGYEFLQPLLMGGIQTPAAFEVLPELIFEPIPEYVFKAQFGM
jgi:hypothetical protein